MTTVPNSNPPSLQRLRQSVNQRSRRRRVMRVGGVCVAAGLLAIVAIALHQRDLGPTETVARHRMAEKAPRPAAKETPTDELEPPMQVLARVVQPEPVFQVDPETQQAWQVGWIETEFSVPMDIKQFSPDQRAQFQHVLLQNNELPSL